MEFSFYSGNIYDSFCKGHVTLERFIDAHKNPTEKTAKLLLEINKASMDGDKKRKAKLKEQLHSFTPSVFVPVDVARRYDNIKSFNPLMQLDYDKIPDTETAKELKQFLFSNYNHIICAYLSPSKLGVKCLMRITTPTDVAHFKRMHNSITDEMEQYGYFDTATKNCILPLFLSADKEILFRDFEDCAPWVDEKDIVIDYVHLNNVPTGNYNSAEAKKNHTKVVDVFCRKMRDIIDGDGHPRLRSACLILGSRVAAGYIDFFEAEQMAINEINSNSYLQKGISNYVKTAKWAINQGMNNAKYF